MRLKYSKIHRQNFIDNYTCTYSFFVVCAEFYVARMRTKIYRSCPHHI